MKNFHDIRYDGAVGRDLECSVAFVTDVVRTKKGNEYRNSRIAQPRHGYRWSVARATTEMDGVRSFYNARKGSKASFRFLDPFDSDLPLTVLSTGSTGTDFDIVKRYAAGGTTFERRILLPDTSQTTVYVNSTALASSAWSMTTDYRLRLNAAPGAGKPVSIEGVFDVPCRFDAELSARIASPEADNITVELTEAKYSPAVTFSTASSWSAKACNVFDATAYFYDNFSAASLSTYWVLNHLHTSDPDPRPYRSGSSSQGTTVSGGYFYPDIYDDYRYMTLCLQVPLHPPFRIRQVVKLLPSTHNPSIGFLHYGVVLDVNPTTGAESTQLSMSLTWPFIGSTSGLMNITGTSLPHNIPYDAANWHEAFIEMNFTTSLATMKLLPSTGGAYELSKATTLVADSTYYAKVINFVRHGYKLDWIEVKSL